jgi:hypothetical protein
MARFVNLLLLVVGLALVLPVVPSTAEAATEQVPPHVRRRRPAPPPPPPPPPPHVHRRRVIHTAPTYAPAVRPRQPIADPVTSIYFGLGAVGNFLVESDDRVSQIVDSGGGLELFLGFRFSRYAAFELGGLFTFHKTEDRLIETGMMNAVTGDLKVFFIPSSRRIEPFIQLGLGAYILTRDGWDGNELTGGGFQLGGGVDIRLNSSIAIGTRLLYRGAFLDNSEARFWFGAPYENTFLNMFTLSANLQVHF